MPQIKKAPGISGIESTEYAFRSKASDPGAQIDLLIDRADGAINFCGMKCAKNAYALDKEAYGKLLVRAEVFRKKAEPKKAIHLALVIFGDLAGNAHSDAMQSIAAGEDLFV